MKMSLNPKTIAALTPVLEWLENGGHHIDDEGQNIKFDYGVFSEHIGYVSGNCGTACCIAGAVTQFNPNLFENDEVVDGDNDIWGDYIFGCNSHVGVELSISEVAYRIGLTPEQSAKLFFATTDVERPSDSSGELLGDDNYLKNVTADRAARVLRNFMETGKVDWNC